MLFVWTNNGGPLQWIGLVMFALQIILPNVLYWLEESDYNTGGYYYYHDGNVYYSNERMGSGSNGGRNVAPLNIQQEQQRATPPPEPPLTQQEERPFEVQGIQFSFTFAIIACLFLTLWMVCSRDNDTPNRNAHAHAERPREQAGAGTDGAEDREPQEQQRPIDHTHGLETPSRFQMIRTKCLQMKTTIRSFLQRWTGWETSDFRFSFLEGLAVGMLIMKLSFIVDFCLGKVYAYMQHAVANSDPDGEGFLSTSTLLYWIPYFHQFMGLCALGFELSRRGVIFGRQQAAADGAGRRMFTREQQQAKMTRMIDVIRKVPLEMYVCQREGDEADCNNRDEGDLRQSYDMLSVSELKQMLKRRGVSREEMDSFVDRQNMIDRLKQCRQYSNSCCICFEDYEEGDPVCVLPQCHHELHAECLDKWIYTFANNPTKLAHEPSCPLCKVEIKCSP